MGFNGFNGIDKFASDFLERRIDYTEEDLGVFKRLTEDSVVHGTAPFRLGDPEIFYTREGVQKQLDAFTEETGLVWTLRVHSDGIAGVEKTYIKKI